MTHRSSSPPCGPASGSPAPAAGRLPGLAGRLSNAAAFPPPPGTRGALPRAWRRQVATGVWAALALSSAPASAQNYRGTPLGGRTATMGGAATAAGNDSAMPYVNPAGLAGVPGDIFAVSASVYGHISTAYKRFFFPTGSDPAYGPIAATSESFESTTTFELPSSVMYYKQIGRPDADWGHRLGVALVIPTVTRSSLVANFAGAYPDVNGRRLITHSARREGADYWLGPSYAVGYKDRLRFGVSAFLVYRQLVFSLSQQERLSLFGGAGDLSSTTTGGASARAFGATLVAGAQARVVDKLWAGLGVSAPSVPLSGRYVSNSAGSVSGGTGFDLAVTRAANYEFRTPLRLNGGLAWDDRKRFSFALDAHYYLPLDRAERLEGVDRVRTAIGGDLPRDTASEVVGNSRAEGVFSVSVGAEAAVADWLSVRAGFFTDRAWTPKIGASPGDLGRARVNRFGLTGGLGSTFGSFDTTAGLVFLRGTGDYGAANNRGATPTFNAVASPMTENTILFVLSGAVTTEEAKRTIERAVPFKLPQGGLPELPGEDARLRKTPPAAPAAPAAAAPPALTPPAAAPLKGGQ